MEQIPDPPAQFPVDAITKILHPGTRIWRIYLRAGDHPTQWDRFRHFGPLGSRFDHHETPRRKQAKGVLYGAEDPQTCIAEFFQADQTVDVRRRRPCLCVFALKRKVVLLDLTGNWPTRAGGSQAINSGSHAQARKWSRRIYEADYDGYPELDGLWYASSMHGKHAAIALYERAKDAIPPAPVSNRSLMDPVLAPFVARAARALNYAVVM